MNSKIAIITLITASLAATGLVAKETAPGQHRTWNRMDRVSSMLNLTDQQKTQAKAIFTQEREAAKPERAQLRAERKAVQTAIQDRKPDAEIRQLAKNESPVLGDLAAERASASAKFYAMLTPAQQQKLNAVHRNWHNRAAARQNSETAPVSR